VTREDEPLSASAEVVLAAVRRSVDVVQEFLETSTRQAAVISSLETELTAARSLIGTLEGETARLRRELTARHQADELEALIEEQNTLAHLFVTSDRLAAARTAREVIDIGIEVLHNLAGVHRYGIWVRTRAGAALRLVAPAEAKYRDTDPEGRLVDRAMATAQPAGEGMPAAIPLLLDGAAVGAIEIRELTPQVGARLGRLQTDLLQFLSDRLASAMVRAAVAEGHPGDAWAQAAAALPATQERTP
jgi:hypothetical protein